MLTVLEMDKDKEEDASHNRGIDYTIHALSFSLFLSLSRTYYLLDLYLCQNRVQNPCSKEQRHPLLILFLWTLEERTRQTQRFSPNGFAWSSRLRRTVEE